MKEEKEDKKNKENKENKGDINLIKKYEYILVKLLEKYFVKYLKKIYDECETLKKFQLYIYNITKWSEKQLNKEYNKFLEKMDYTSDDFIKLLEIVFTLNIKLILNVYYPNDIIDNIEMDIPNENLFWYKCLKSVCKYFYENPKNIKEDIKNNQVIIKDIDNIISKIIKKFLPTSKYINLTQSFTQITKDKINYNYDDKDLDFSSHQNNFNLDVEKLNTQSESNKQLIELKMLKVDENKNYSEKQEEIKEIKLPKYLFKNKKNTLYSDKNEKNILINQNKELDENFF